MLGYYDSFRTLSSKSIDQDSLELVSMYASTINEKYKNKEIIGKSIYDGHNFSRIDDGKILIMHNPYNLDDLSSLAKFHRNDVIIGFYGKKDDKNFSKRMDQMEQIRHHLGRDYTLCTDINNDNYFITMILNSQLEPKESQISEIPSWYYNYDNRHRTLKKIYHHNSDFSLNL